MGGRGRGREGGVGTGMNRQEIRKNLEILPFSREISAKQPWSADLTVTTNFHDRRVQ